MKGKLINYTFYLKFLLIILLFVFLSACGGVTPSTDPPAINSFTADSYHIISGESITLSWNVTGADSVTINQGIGTVDSTGTKVVNPTAAITYTLTANNTTDSVTSTVTINDGIIEEPDTYTVTFDSQDGSAVAPQMVEHGGLVTEPTDPTRTGYTFGGWYKESEWTNAWDFATDTVTVNVTLYAKWTFNIGIIISYYTITFDSQGGSAVSSQMVEYGEKATEPTAPTRTGYTFGGWYTESGYTNAWDFATDTVTSGVTLYAKWAINSYTVNYNGNNSTGGTVPVDPLILYEYGATVTVLGNTGGLIRINDGGTSYRFTGWNTKADGSGTDQAEGSIFTIYASNVTLYAQWTSYTLRDTGPAGGYIFYNKGYYSDGWRYLEAAPSYRSTSAPWGCSGTSISGADGTAVGTGEQNTIDIEAGCTTAGTAADKCANLSLVGYSDWFLPSQDELNLMYTNLKVAGFGGFADDYYWSSSENLANNARIQDFDDGTQYYSTKSSTRRVRAVRAF